MARSRQRHATRILTHAMLLVTLAICVAWVRSYVRPAGATMGMIQDGAEGPYILKRELASVNGGLAFVSDLNGPLQNERQRPWMEGQAGFRWKSDLAASGMNPSKAWLTTIWIRGLGFLAGRYYGRVTNPPGIRPTFWLHSGLWIAIPYWAIAITTGGPSVFFVMRRAIRRGRTSRRRRLGQCVRCGYDLRGTAGPCPECGGSRVATAECPKDASTASSPHRAPH